MKLKKKGKEERIIIGRLIDIKREIELGLIKKEVKDEKDSKIVELGERIGDVVEDEGNG